MLRARFSSVTDSLRSRATYTKLHGVGYLLLTFAYMAVVHYPDSYTGIVRLVVFFRRSPADRVEVSALVQNILIAATAVIVALALYFAHVFGYSRLARIVIWPIRILLVISIADVVVAPAIVAAFSQTAWVAVELVIAVSVFLFYLYSISLLKSAVRPRATDAGGVASRRWLLLIAFLLVPTWSLASAINVATQASVIGYGKRYCVATTTAAISKRQKGGRQDDYSAIASRSELLGTRLYTTETGFKSNSGWYFDAILIVESDMGGRDYWNWSIGSMRFERLAQNRKYVVPPYTACQPRANFIASLPWI
jgi:hypothetical protein